MQEQLLILHNTSCICRVLLFVVVTVVEYHGDTQHSSNQICLNYSHYLPFYLTYIYAIRLLFLIFKRERINLHLFLFCYTLLFNLTSPFHLIYSFRWLQTKKVLLSMLFSNLYACQIHVSINLRSLYTLKY